MIRAIVGTVAAFAAFTVVQQSVDASTGEPGSCVPTRAYALLQAGEDLVVRAEPTPEGALVGRLAVRGDAAGEPITSIVTITGSQGGWAKIALASAQNYDAGAATVAPSVGWIPADALAVDARVDGAISVFNRPGLLGRQMARIEGDDMKFRVLGCRGSWLQVINARYGNVWIDRWCANAEDGCRG